MIECTLKKVGCTRMQTSFPSQQEFKGMTFQLPVVGSKFCFLSTRKDDQIFQTVTTSIENVVHHKETGWYLFRTMNSLYELKVS